MSRRMKLTEDQLAQLYSVGYLHYTHERSKSSYLSEWTPHDKYNPPSVKGWSYVSIGGSSLSDLFLVRGRIHTVHTPDGTARVYVDRITEDANGLVVVVLLSLEPSCREAPKNGVMERSNEEPEDSDDPD